MAKRACDDRLWDIILQKGYRQEVTEDVGTPPVTFVKPDFGRVKYFSRDMGIYGTRADRPVGTGF
jgi:hypothetical protein